MKKLFKILLASLMALSLYSIPQTNVYAKENESLDIALDGFCISTSYDADDYYVVYDENESEYIAIIYDLNNVQVDIFSLEKIENPLTRSTSIRTFRNSKTEISDADGDAVTWVTEIKAIVYASGSFGQINSVETKSIYISNAVSNTTHEDDAIATYPQNNTFPTTRLQVSSSTVITLAFQITEEYSYEFELSKINGSGFSYSYSVGETLYYRKRCDNDYTIKVGI